MLIEIAGVLIAAAFISAFGRPLQQPDPAKAGSSCVKDSKGDVCPKNVTLD